MRHFIERQKHRIHVNRERCCSNCNPETLALTDIDSYSLYQARATKLTKAQSRVEEKVLGWCEQKVLELWPNPGFAQVTDLFLPKEQLSQVVRDPDAAKDKETFSQILGDWEWGGEYGDDLWEQFSSAVRNEAARSTHQPRTNAVSITPVRIPGTVSGWAPIETHDSIVHSHYRRPQASRSSQPNESLTATRRPTHRKPLSEISTNTRVKAPKRQKRM